MRSGARLQDSFSRRCCVRRKNRRNDSTERLHAIVGCWLRIATRRASDMVGSSVGVFGCTRKGILTGEAAELSVAAAGKRPGVTTLSTSLL